MPLGTWGPVTFEVSAERVRTWNEYRRSGASRWAQQDVHLAKPVREFLGPGIDAVSLGVRLAVAEGLDPEEELTTLREARDTGAVYDLIIGDEVQGQFSLEDIGENRRRSGGNGAPLVVDVDLQLKEYN